MNSDPRFNKFIDRFLEDERFAAVMGGDEKSASSVSAALIARLFPKPVLQLKSQQTQTEDILHRFKDAVTSGKVTFLECVFQLSRSLIPAEPDHEFQTKPIAESHTIRDAFSVNDAESH